MSKHENLLAIIKKDPDTPYEIKESFLLGKEEIDTENGVIIYFDETYFNESEEEFFTYDSYVFYDQEEIEAFSVLSDGDKIIMVTDELEYAEYLEYFRTKAIETSTIFKFPEGVTASPVVDQPIPFNSTLSLEPEAVEEEPQELPEPPVPANLGEQVPFLSVDPRDYSDEIADF